MGYRTDIRLPVSTAAYSTTTTSLAGLVIQSVSGQRICVTGVSFAYDVPAATPIKPLLLDGANTMALIGFVQTGTTVQFFNPVCGSVGNSVTAQSSTSGIHTINISLQYYLDDR